jgi:ATP-binding cassette subfamily B (MDR/TAP) protein 1
VKSGNMTDSHSFTVILAVIVAATAMTTIAPQIINLTKAASSAEEMFRTIDRKSEIDPMSEEGLVPSTCEGVIEIKDVAFAYPARPDIPVLKGLTLSAPAHKTTALVGASGSGKSTIIGLLGMYPSTLALPPRLTLRRTLVQSIKWHDTHGRH